MQGLWTSSSSRVWTVLSSIRRAPASHAATMFCAICVCGPAATPYGVSSTVPRSTRRKRSSARGTKNPARGMPKTDPDSSSSVKAQSVSCSIERGRKRSDISGPPGSGMGRRGACDPS